VVLEEAGAALLPGPYFSTMALAVPFLLEAGTDVQKEEVLAAIAAGRARSTVAFAEASGSWSPELVRMEAAFHGDCWHLTGEKLFVADAAVADYVIVVARATRGSEVGLRLFLVKGRPQGMQVHPLQSLDLTRRWYTVTFNDVALEPAALMGLDGETARHIGRALEQSTAALSVEMVGSASRVLDLSVEYAKSRHQFGKPIGSFQAVSHKIADMLVQTEGARAASYYACWAIAADSVDRSLAVSIAKACTSDAIRFVAANGIQVHGGIGYTWEHDAHLYFRRAKAAEVTFGDAAYHRELIAQSFSGSA
jgi:alkylation response protein AidB-like acyl-CoA dehydrogenase